MADDAQKWLDGILGTSNGKKKIGSHSEKASNNGTQQSSGRIGSSVISGAAEVVSRALGNKTQAEINQQQLSKDINVQRARLDSDRNAQLIQALGNVRGPMSLLTNLIGVTVAQRRKPNIDTNTESTGTTKTSTSDKGGNYESEAKKESGVQHEGTESEKGFRDWRPGWVKKVEDKLEHGFKTTFRKIGLPEE